MCMHENVFHILINMLIKPEDMDMFKIGVNTI